MCDGGHIEQTVIITSDKIQFAKRYSIILINFTIYLINIWWDCSLTQAHRHTPSHAILSHKLTNGIARYSLRYINYIYIIFKFSTDRFDLCRDNGNVCVLTAHEEKDMCISKFQYRYISIKIYYFEKIKKSKRIHITVNVKNAGQTRIA